MSHFLARLVQRARGTAPRVEPIIASRFAPAPIVEVASEAEAPPPPGRGEPESAVEKKSFQREIVKQDFSIEKVEGQTVLEPEKSPLAPEVVVSGEKPEKLLVPPEKVAAEPPMIVRPSQARDGPVPLVKSGTVRKDSLARLPAKRPRAATPITTMLRHLERGAITPNESREDPPIVRVTIGRIDVRATPAAVPARKSSAPSEPKLTLDAYLKSRREGRR